MGLKLMSNEFEFDEFERREINKDGEYEWVKTYQLKKYNGIEKEIVIPEFVDGIEVRAIGGDCFKDNETVEKVTLPKSIKVIMSYAFSGCIKLKQINLEEVEYIGAYAFISTNIKKVIMKNIEEIGMSAFSNCTELQEVIIENSIKIIGREAFENCKKLNKVVLPESLEQIQNHAFEGCPNIVEFLMPNNVRIGLNTFDEKVRDLLKSYFEANRTKYNLETLLKETKEMENYEIELYIKKLLKEHKLDSFDLLEISDMNNIAFNKENGEITWKCFSCSYCVYDLWDLLANNGKMIEYFDTYGCGLCGYKIENGTIFDEDEDEEDEFEEDEFDERWLEFDKLARVDLDKEISKNDTDKEIT